MDRMCIVVAIMCLVLLVGLPAACNEPGHNAHVAKPGERGFHILKDLPDEAEAYQEPAAALVRAGIPDKYGHEEWAAIVLTHEFHQHVGIMTLTGAKMAVRARELLDAPARSIHVTVETGPKPPLACAIDGIQAAIASTLAQELIDVPENGEPKLAATFVYENRAVRLSLRPEYSGRVQGFIAKAIRDFGNLTPAYFEEIERLSYQVWRDFDRKQIFNETWLEGAPEIP